MTKHTITSDLKEKIENRMKEIPAFQALGVQTESLIEGECVAVVPRNKAFDGVFKSFHGGLLMTAADSVALLALMTKVGTESTFATTDMNIRFLAPCLTDVRVFAKVIKAGKLLCPIQVDLYDLTDKHVAIAMVNYIQMNQPLSR